MTKIFLISSIILNSFLLIYLFGLVPFLLFLSITGNVSIIVYTRFLLDDRVKVRNDFNALMLKIENFLVHLSSIYELEMFYGDDTLHALINHSKRLISDFYDYEEEYFANREEEDTIIYDATEEEENKEKEEFIFHEGP